MFHRSSLLMTGLILMMGLAWFGMQHYFGDERQARADTPPMETSRGG